MVDEEFDKKEHMVQQVDEYLKTCANMETLL